MAPGHSDGVEDRRRLLIACACLVAAVTCIWCLRVFVWANKYPGFGDIFRYYYPVYEFFYSNLASGQLLLWNPFQLNGVPTVATLQGGFFYPPHVLYLIFPTAFAMGVLGLLHFLWIAISTLLFARALGLSPMPAFVAAVFCAFAPAYHDMLLAPNLLETAAWLPAGALVALKLARQPSRRGLAGLAGIVAVTILAGYPQAAVYNFYVWGGVFVIELARTATGPRQWVFPVVFFGSALGVGVLMAAIQLAPTLELSQIGLRSLEALDASQLFGGRTPRPRLMKLLGPVAGTLICVSLFSRKHRVMALALFGLGVASYLVSFGWPPMLDLFLSLPFIDSFRHPNRIVYVTSFCVAVLTGMGLEALTSRVRAGFSSNGRSSEGGARAGLLFAAALCVAFSIWMLESSRSSTRGTWGLAVAGLFALHWRVRGPDRFGIAVGIAVGLAVAAESLIFPIRHWELLYSDSSQMRAYRQPPAALVRLAGATAGTTAGTTGRVLSVGLSAGEPPIFPKNGASLIGLRSIDGYEPFGLSWQRAYWEQLIPPPPKAANRLGFTGLRATTGHLRKSRASRRSRLLDLAAMRWLVTPTPVSARFGLFLSGSNMRRVSLDGLEDGDGSQLAVFENMTALPRAFATYRAEPAPGTDELLKRLAKRGFDPLELSYVESGPPLDPTTAHGHSVEIVRDDPSVVEIRATLAAPALVVLADTYHPGWKASIDAEPAEVYRANQMYRGVYAPAGRHLIRFEFDHPAFWQGAAISVVSLVGLIFFVARGSRSTASG